MGGVIYIINVINTLSFLDDEDKPEIVLFYRSDLKKFLLELNYPYLQIVEWPFLPTMKGTLTSIFLRKNLFIRDLLTKYKLHSLYPLQDYPVRTNTETRLVSWCADFQHRHYPEFFSWIQRIGRNMRTRLALKNTNDLVLSSNDAYGDLKIFFRIPDSLKVHVYHFVSVIDNEKLPDFKEIVDRYSLPDSYFLVSNQFHKHKNHRVVLYSLAKMKQSGIKKHFVFTGKLPDDDNSLYIEELRQVMNDYDLHDQISILGTISRKDQLALMRYSQAVVQPSFFEGWSTVIEDAKSLQVPVIASNIGVNVEQLGEKGTYFTPQNVEELVSVLKDYPQRNLNDVFYEGYHQRIRSAAYEILDILI